MPLLLLPQQEDSKLRALLPSYQPTQASEHEKIRAMMAALEVLGTQLKTAA